MRRFIMLASALSLVCVAGAAMAQPKPEDVIKYRKSVMGVVKGNFAHLAGMAKSDDPLKGNTAKKADNLAFISTMALDAFSIKTDKSPDSKSKEEVWSKKADFDAGMKKFEADTAKLAALAKAGDAAGFKAQVGEVQKNCKACHDAFKEE